MRLYRELPAVLLLLAAFSLRTLPLEAQSLWPDEGISWYLAAHLADLPRGDHPPLYFVGLAAWMGLGGDSVFSLRFFSVAADMLLVALLCRWGRQFGRGGAGETAAFLWALSPLALWYAGEARGYTWLAFLATLASYLLLTAQRPGLYFLTGAACLLIHPFAGFLLAGHGWLIWSRKGQGGSGKGFRWAWVAFPMALVPWLMVAAQRVAEPTYWPGVFLVVEALKGSLATWAAGPAWTEETAAQQAGLILLILAGSGAAAWATGREVPWASPRRRLLAVWSLGLFPLLLAGGLVFEWPKYAPRYLIFLFPFLTWLVAEALIALGRLRPWGWAVGLPLLAGLVGFSGWVLLGTLEDPAQQRPEFHRTLAYVQEHALPGDALILVGGHTEPVVRYYLRGTMPLYPLPPGLLIQVTNPLTPGRVASALQEVAARHRRAWLLLWQEPLADPLRLTLTSLLGHAQRLEVAEGFEQVALLLFAFPQEAVFEARPIGQHPLGIPFNTSLNLAGFDLTRDGFWFERCQTELQGGPPFTDEWPSFRQGETVYVALYWQVRKDAPRDYTAFVQLLDAGGRWVAGDDHPLGGDRFPASWWAPGETYAQYHALALPKDLPPGTYRALAGLYWRDEQGTIRRVPRADNGEEQVVLGQVVVSP